MNENQESNQAKPGDTVTEIVERKIQTLEVGGSQAEGGTPLNEVPGRVWPWIIVRFSYVILLQFMALHGLWIQSFRAGAARGWDASAHYAAALIYNQTIYPDTFGWTPAYFLGMPFPNYYPPLLFCLIASLAHAGVPFDTAFKLIALVPTICTVSVLWLLALKLFGKRVAFWTALFGFLQMMTPQLNGGFTWSNGLNYDSTFIVGFYAQSLGFVLLILWYILYESPVWSISRFVWATVLLALSVLSNYLSAVTASLFILSSVTFDVIFILRQQTKRHESHDPRVVRSKWHLILWKILSPLVAALLTLFWSEPMLATYRFFVSRPFRSAFYTPIMVIVQVIAIAAGLVSLPRVKQGARPLIVVCILLSALILFSTEVPTWLPFQAFRFSSTLSFLLTVPVGLAISSALRGATKLLGPRLGKWSSSFSRRIPTKTTILVIGMTTGLVLAFVFSRLPGVEFIERAWTKLGFYPADPFVPRDNRYVLPNADSSSSNMPDRLLDYKGDFGSSSGLESMRDLLQFARTHRDGGYLVCLPNDYKFILPSLEAKAISAYLGAQGNESVYTVYREASASSVFLFPQADALSPTAEGTPRFGLSSALADDFDFIEQPLSHHIARLGWLGIHYLVVYDERVKKRVSAEGLLSGREDFGQWSILTLRNAPRPFAEALQYRPALYVGDFTLKMRRSDDHNFVRLAEEQFFDNWFDVLLVRSPVVQINRLTNNMLDQFGALVLETYEFDQFDASHVFEAYDVLRNFARTRPLILVPRDEYLFNRIRTNLDEFPCAFILDVNGNQDSTSLENVYGPTKRYGGSQMRREWQEIKEILAQHKISVLTGGVADAIKVETTTRKVQVTSTTDLQRDRVPILLRMTYHPRWKPSGMTESYAAGPWFTILFSDQEASLTFSRSPLDKACAVVSVVCGLVLALLLLFGSKARAIWRQN